ncbi:MAG TPA: (d)CMP kinase [Clostridiaceae bacterium]|nr:(d)CMP kinase [Clostridiaceae bacterium]
MTHAIAIDGMSGVGKSTIAKVLAKRLGINYLDTGAMYRALAFSAHNDGIPFTDEDLVADWLPRSGLEIELDKDRQKTLIHGQDVSNLIRSAEMSRLSSAISALPPVRYYCVEMQRALADERPLVLDGRDIGSFVLPAADFKFYLEADAEVRARRRWRQTQETTQGSTAQTFEQILAEMLKRDQNDSSRKLAPAMAAPDSIIINTNTMTVEEVLTHILDLMRIKAASDKKINQFWSPYLVAG